MMLCKDADTKSWVFVIVSFRDLKMFDQQIQKCRFTDTVSSDDSQSRFHLDMEVDTGEDGGPFTVTEVA